MPESLVFDAEGEVAVVGASVDGPAVGEDGSFTIGGVGVAFPYAAGIVEDGDDAVVVVLEGVEAFVAPGVATLSIPADEVVDVSFAPDVLEVQVGVGGTVDAFLEDLVSLRVVEVPRVVDRSVVVGFLDDAPPRGVEGILCDGLLAAAAATVAAFDVFGQSDHAVPRVVPRGEASSGCSGLGILTMLPAASWSTSAQAVPSTLVTPVIR